MGVKRGEEGGEEGGGGVYKGDFWGQSQGGK